jgi:hypothetical protein
MSSVSEQDHLNPRDPLYYAPRWLRDRSATSRDVVPAAPYASVSYDSQLEGAVSDALRHPLDPEVMRDPEPEEKRPLWSVAARFAAAIGVSAVVALFFVVVVPGSRQSDSEPAATSGVAQSIKSALFQSKETSPKPAISEFQSILASTPPGNQATAEQSGQLLKQFMQWRTNPAASASASAAPPRTNQ